MIDRSSYCFDIHHTLSLKFYNGTTHVGPCCLADHVKLTSTHQVNEYWNTNFLVNLREENLQSKIIPWACRSCEKTEKTGADSRRSNHLKFYSDDELNQPGIRMLDIHLPNLCNLRCTICGPHDSSSWISDAKALGNTVPLEYIYNKQIKYNTIGLSIPDTLETVKFWGGEPLLDELHADILEKIDQAGLLSNLRISYNTNGTTRVSQRVLEIWSRAKLVELYFSIDDVDSRSDYQRFGSSWQQINENIQWFTEAMPTNHLFYVMCSVSMLNICNLPKLVEWQQQNFKTNRYGDEVQLLFNPVVGVCEVKHLDPEFFSKLKNKHRDYPQLQNLLNGVKVVDNYIPVDFLNFVDRLDKIRGTDFYATFPEYSRN